MKTETKRYVGMLSAIVVGIVMISPIFSAVSTGTAAGPQYFLAHFMELPDSDTRGVIEHTGVNILTYMGNGVYLVRAPASISDNSVLGHYIDDISVYPESIKISSELRIAQGMIPIRVQLHDGETPEGVIALLESYGAQINKVHDVGMTYIRCTLDARYIPNLAGLNEVNAIHEDPEPVALMNLITSNTYMGHDTPQANGFTGSGMLAEVQDNGIDRNHPDLANVDWTDGSVVVDHHGTCTSGIVFGNGAGDMNAQGIAYQAVGAFSDWGTGRSTSIANLWNGDFNEGMAGMNGVVQSNSWSQGTCDGLYQAYAAEDDQAAVDYPKVLQLWAAANSNDGTAEGRISEDSAAKNVMCIGAIFHQNTATMADDRYELYSTGNTPSRGPAADGRQKPDMAGCFDWIYTVDCLGTDGYASGDYYDDFGGTSGATPEVAGSSVLAYEMYKENYFGNNPTNAIPYSSTIKALMIADAYQYPLTGTYSATRTCQGWGTPDMENMYNLGETYHQFDEYPQAMSSGSTWDRLVYSDGTKPLKITLCWIDPAAPSTTNALRALRNNLDLKVTSPTGTVYYGNNGLWDNLYSVSGTAVNHWSTSSSYRDDLNNVENVFIQSPQAGLWTIEVSGRTGDIAQGPQQFSLVSSGARVPITSLGMVMLDEEQYAREDTVTIEVWDVDLNTNPSTAQTVNVNLRSNAEPAGETVLLTETGPDTSVFSGSKTISATNSAGVVQVNPTDLLTATYNDANDGTGHTATPTATATVDGTVLSTSDLNVDWWGVTNTFDYASSFALTRGTQSGTYSLTYDQDDSYHQIIEATSGGAGRKNIGAVYTINLDAAGVTPFTVYMDAYRVGDDTLTAAYSTNGGASYTTMGTITNTADTDTYKVWGITATPGGTVLIRITGTDVAGEATDTLYVDHLYIQGGSTSNPTDHNTLNWTLSGDDGAGQDDVVQYNIYRSSSQTGPWTTPFTNVPAGTVTYTDVDKGQLDGTTWWYVVRAEDALGNEDTNTNSMPEPNPGPSDDPPTVTVNAPNGGENYLLDSSITITWSATDDNPWPSPSCWIYYDTDTNPTGQILITSAVSASAGTYSWNSAGVPAGNYYIHIVVQDSAAQQGQDWSNNYFTIYAPDTPPTVTVNIPNGGEVYAIDTSITITWTAIDDKAWPSPSCWIYYDTNTNPSGQILITNAVSAAAGSYLWDNTGVPAGDYYIHIVVQDSAAQQGEDWSNNFFTIEVPAYDIDLTAYSAGNWVMVSFPVAVSGAVNTLLLDSTEGDGGTTWDIALWWDPQDSADPWKTYRFGGTSNDLSTINNQMGIWLHLTANGGDKMLTLATRGTYSTSNVNINLYTGWNLVSYPSATNSLASGTLPAEADRVSVWQAVTPYVNDITNLNAVTFTEGNAYWVHVTSDCVWSVAP